MLTINARGPPKPPDGPRQSQAGRMRFHYFPTYLDVVLSQLCEEKKIFSTPWVVTSLEEMKPPGQLFH